MSRSREDGRIRVVFVDHVARLSGGEIALVRVLPELSKYVDVYVLLGEDGPLVGRLAAVGVAAEVVPMAPRLRDVRRESVRAGAVDPRALASLPAYVLGLRRRFRALGADIVHTNSLKAAFYAGVAARLAGLPVVWHIRDRIAADYLPASAVRLVRLGARIFPTTIVANSQATLETLPQRARSGALRDSVVPDAVEPPARVVERGGGPLVFGVLGRLAPWKGQGLFLEAFAEAFRGSPVRARIVGGAMFGEHAYAEELRRQAGRLGIAGQVEFVGFRDDIWAVLAGLDVLVHCSVVPEPFGLVVLEGMAAGRPVIAAAAGGPRELITDGVDGVLVPAGDAIALARAMRVLADDEGLRRALGGAARLRSRDFSPDRAARQLCDVYRRVLVGGGRAELRSAHAARRQGR